MFSDAQIALLREYVLQGGFIFAEAGCQSEDFDRSFHEMIDRMYPDGESELKKLTADHPIFRAEYLIDPGPNGQYMELFGVDVGCRTGIVYSKKNNLCCLWDHWTSFPLPKRSLATTERVTKGMQMGVNIVAYATGREVPDKLDPKELKSTAGQQDLIQRGLIQIAKVRYTGDWNPAPQAVRNLLLALNQQLGPVASTKQESLLAQDAGIFSYPLLYIHGRNNFALTQKERDNLKMYIERGNVLIADACCSAPQFDKAFRQLLEQLFPGQLKRIPPDHAVFSQGFNLQRIKRREPDSSGGTLKVITREAEPYLEGIEINGRFVVIYSRYDISCALEKQSSVACTGYLHEDAVKLAISMVRYALLQ